jgi:hypothetical protein
MGKYSAVTEAEVALAVATAKTVLNLTGGTGTLIEVTALGLAFDGITSTDAPGIVRIVRTTAAPTVTACTEKIWGHAQVAATGAAGYNAAAEGTKETVSLITTEVHPQGGSFVLSWARGEGIWIPATASAGLSIECTFGAIVNCHAWIEWWE